MPLKKNNDALDQRKVNASDGSSQERPLKKIFQHVRESDIPLRRVLVSKPTTMIHWGKTLRTIRYDLGLTAEELEMLAKLSPGRIQKWEKRTTLGPQTIIKIRALEKLARHSTAKREHSSLEP